MKAVIFEMFSVLLVVGLLFVTSECLQITCGGMRHQPQKSSMRFRGCFVTQGIISYEILGEVPSNFTGAYGVMFLTETNDCILQLDLGRDKISEYTCGTVTTSRGNNSVKSVFSHFTISARDLGCKGMEQLPVNQ